MVLAIARGFVVTAVGLLFLAGCGDGNATATLIVNALVVDGTGEAPRELDVRIRGGRIAEVGELVARQDEAVIDARGRALAPGFIDTHSHHDRGLLDDREAVALVSQGVTTIVVGQDGASHVPLADFFGRLEDTPPAINVASYAGHNTIRHIVLQDDFERTATESEIQLMRELLRKEMESGALGLSTGLEYDPGIYATTAEVVELAREAASVGGRYASHMRSEDRELWSAVDELLTIGSEAEIPVHASHLKLAMRSLWGKADVLLARLDSARDAGVDVTADVYPYPYWQSTMTVLFPERDFTNRATASFALTELTSPDGMLLAAFSPDTSYIGKTLAEIAALRGSDPVTTYIDLIAESRDGSESVIATSMHEADIASLIAWRYASICTDGSLAGRHPRGIGTFPRVFARYVRTGGVLTLEEAVRKMTSLAAANTGIEGRGTIRTGYYADLVLFDPEVVADRATPENPQLTSVGVEMVWVNGVVVYRNEAGTGHYPGVVIRRAR